MNYNTFIEIWEKYNLDGCNDKEILNFFVSDLQEDKQIIQAYIHIKRGL
jgi:hypothetical protein